MTGAITGADSFPNSTMTFISRSSMTDAEYVINHLSKLKTWSRFVNGTETDAITYLLTTIPTKDTALTHSQYGAFLKLSGAIDDRFRQAPEGSIIRETL